MILKNSEKKNFGWPAAQKMMKPPQKFIDDLVTWSDKNSRSIEEWKKDLLAPMLKLDFFTPEAMVSKSSAASYLCAFVVNIVKFNMIYLKVKPL